MYFTSVSFLTILPGTLFDPIYIRLVTPIIAAQENCNINRELDMDLVFMV